MIQNGAAAQCKVASGQTEMEARGRKHKANMNSCRQARTGIRSKLQRDLSRHDRRVVGRFGELNERRALTDEDT